MPQEDPALGATHPLKLTDTRLELHWAAQVAGAAGLTYIEAKSDYSHTSLVWDDRLQALVGGPIGPDGTPRTGIRLDDPAILLVGGDSIATFNLAGRTLDAAYQWLADAISRALGHEVARQLTRFDHDMPHHAVADGAEFSEGRPEHRELAAWYAKSNRILSQLTLAYPSASPVRCWPHHFDIACLIHWDPPEDGEDARSIGVGMSPGDASYDQPYWYVTPWPYPETAPMERLPAGSWHTEGWIGAVLTGSEVVDTTSAHDQTMLILRFLKAAINASEEVLRHQK